MRALQGLGHCLRPLVSWARVKDVPQIAAGQIRTLEQLWQEFFSDPSQWWDHRSEKINSRYPDFKHRKREQSLWLIDKLKPPWVEAELAALAPGMLQMDLSTWNKRLVRSVKAKQYERALQLFEQMQKEGLQPNMFSFVPVLKACSSLRALREGQRIHTQIIDGGYESDVYVGNSLVDMYSKCGNIEDAWRVFTKMPIRNVVTWNAMILGYVKCRRGQKAIELYQQMAAEGVEPDPVTFVGILNACASSVALEKGRHVHEQIVQKGCESNVFVASSLVDMYAKCASMENARKVFLKMPMRNVVSWNALIMGYVKCGQGRKALALFHQMAPERVEPDPFTFVAVLNACASVAALEEGRPVHKQIIERNCESNVFVASSLVNMYAKCGSVEDASRVFNKMATRDVVAWSAMILGYVKCGQGQKALELSQQMQQEGVGPDPVTFVGVLNACASVVALEEGRRVHKQIIQRGFESNVFVANSLVDMYAKCGCIKDARRVFDKMPTQGVVTWSAMIFGYVKCGEGWKALELFHHMQREEVQPDPGTFVGVLNACASVASLEEGKRVHEHILQRGFDCDVAVGNSLVDMYSKCGSVEDAWTVFTKMHSRTVVSWNAMIAGYVRCGQGQKALELYQRMSVEGVDPDAVSFVAVLNACASLEVIEEGRIVHKQIIQIGCESNVFVASSLVDMYAKCGNIEDAWRVFNNMPIHDVVAWSAMILGYVKCGQGQKALQLYQQMQFEGVEPNSATFVCVLNACASVMGLAEGQGVHKQIIQKGHESDISVVSSLIDMYAKCGSIEDALSMFKKISTQNVVVWNAMLAGYAMHGHAQESIKHFEEMHQDGVEMDDVSFVSLLSACSHGGLVAEGLSLFESMVAVYNVSPTVEHYTCVIDLLGRAGHLYEAEDILSTMLSVPNVDVWRSLLGACRIHGNVEMGERIAKQTMKLDPGNAAGYVLLSNIYAVTGQ